MASVAHVFEITRLVEALGPASQGGKPLSPLSSSAFPPKALFEQIVL